MRPHRPAVPSVTVTLTRNGCTQCSELSGGTKFFTQLGVGDRLRPRHFLAGRGKRLNEVHAADDAET
jgi:hypothetical protein